MNKTYEKPEMNLMFFTSDDVIATSNSGLEGFGPDTDDHYEFGERP